LAIPTGPDDQKTTHYHTEVVAEDVIFLDRKRVQAKAEE
jgi:hypothetical protein